MRRGMLIKNYNRGFAALLFLLAILALLVQIPAHGFMVSAVGPGGQASQTVAEPAGGNFDLTVPLNKNAVNKITVTAVDAAGNTASKEIAVTQVSLDSIVVSQVTTERLSVEQVTQLVNDGVIKLDNPANYNVSKFDIVLTIADQPVQVSVPIAVPKELEQTGWEVYKLPQGDGSSGGRPPNAPEVQIIIFEKYVSSPDQPKISIPGVIIIEGKIKSLKEFYNVRLLLMNTSGIFTLKDVMANIEFPDGGLSKVLPADGINSFGNILPGDGGKPGQVEKQFTIRGDEIGIRHIKVNFGGTVIGPGIPEDKAIPFNGSAITDVEVKGPPTFQVKVTHPDSVTLNVPYELKVDIINTSDIAAMYASLALDVGADAQLVKCEMNANLEPQCTPIEGSDVRNFGNILPGKSVSEVFTINPLRSGVISSCVAASDQNISLQVLVGTIGCVVGTFPPIKGVPDGVPTVTVLPVANATGIGSDTPVTAFFSEKMDTSSITIGSSGTFSVRDKGNNILPGQLRFVEIDNKTVAIWQILGGLAGNTEYTVVLKKEIRDLQGNGIFNEWTSRFTTTAMGPDDTTPPTVTLSVEPPVNPNFVLPGQIVKVNAYASDQGSGVSRVELRTKDLDVQGALFTLVDQKTAFQGDKPPYIFSINSANLVGGHTYQVMATAYDKMGNAQNATISLVIAASATPPTVTLPNDLPTIVLQGISVSLTPQVTGGVLEVRYYLDGAAAPFKTVNLAPYQAVLSTLNLPLGTSDVDRDYSVRVVAEDGLGQTGQSTYIFTLRKNINMPTVSLPGLVNGAQYITGSSFTVKADAQDPVGIQSVTLYLDGTSIGTGIQPILLNTTNLSLGGHTVSVQAVNTLGVSNSLADAASFRTFSVVDKPNGPAPAAPSITGVSYPLNGQVTVTGTAVAGARVDITNTTLGITLTTYANSSGVFSAVLPGDVGQGISALQYNFATSQQPSTSTTSTIQTPPSLRGLSASPSSINFTAASAYQDIVVTGTYSDHSTANVTSSATFSSSNPGVASVNSAGRVVALSTGSAVITASVNGLQAQVSVTSSIITLTGITVAPTALNLVALGQTQQLTVTGLYTDGLSNWSETLTGGISYITGNPAIAIVNSSGLVTARGNGNTQISVSRSGLPALSVPVNVNTGTDPAPTVEILSPANGTQVERGQMVSISTRALDAIGGVTRVLLNVTGQTTYSEIRQVASASLSTNQTFTFTVSNTAAIGGTIAVNLTAEDTGGNTSSPASVTLNVVDQTAPAVAITTPANQARFNYGDTVNIAVSASDALGVTQIRYQTTGAVTSSKSQAFSAGALSANASFSFTIPFGIQNPDVRIVAYARDAAGNERASIPVDIVITDADITSSSTRVTAVAIPNGSAVGTVTYEVTSGLNDLDHVELYFRRNGIGTFNRYTDADHGNPQGKFIPQNGSIGTISFDSTKMGGDGTYEFYSVGVDQAGNREAAPRSLKTPKDYSGLLAYYPFNGNALDESGNGNNGNVIGALLTTGRFGEVTTAYSFNGTNASIMVSDSSTLDLGPAFTLSALVNPASLMQDPGQGAIISKVGGAGGLNGYQMGITNSNQTIWCQFNASGEGWPGNQLLASVNVPINVWSHVACSYDNNTLRIYLNGAVVASKGVGAKSVVNSSSNFRISSDDQSNGWFSGTIDEVAIYSHALSDDEIRQLSNAVTPDQTATFSAGTVWTTINTPTLIGEGEPTFDNQNIRVTGTTFTVNGTHSFRNVELLNGAVLTHTAATDPVTHILNMNLWTLTIDGTSAIDLTGRGYRGGRQDSNWDPGLTSNFAVGSQHAAGGSHGGLGSIYDVSGSPAPVYDSFISPIDLGSGGGNYGTYGSGAGGGAFLLQAINVVNDNTIKSHGAQSIGSASGCGGGGSINITTRTFSGNGTIAANGGGSGVGVGGGGGRISIRYLDMATGNQNSTTAVGGQGQYGARAANGTVFLKQEGQDTGELVIDGQAGDTAWTTLVIPSGFTFNNITLRNNARVVTDSPLQVTDRLLLTGNSVLIHSEGNEAGLAIAAKHIQIDAGSAVDASGRGYRGGRQGTNWDVGLTLGGLDGSQGATGGSYGGKGGGYEGRDSGLIYGDPRNPVSLGSGGGNYGTYGSGAGGGRITIRTTNSLVVNGAIRADGGLSSGSASGDGSGGSILIQTSGLSGTGTISANGGGHYSAGVGGSGVGGGGGRVAIYCDYLDSIASLGELRNISAFAGHDQFDGVSASAGTVYVKFNQGEEELFIDDNSANATASRNTPLTPIGTGLSGAITGNSLKTDGQRLFLPNGLIGLRLNPDLNQLATFTISGNTADTMTVLTPNEEGVAFANVAAVGKSYSGFYRYDNLTFRRGGNLLLGDRLEVPGILTIAEHGMLSHYAAGDSFASGLYLTVGFLNIDSTSRIDVTGRGYRGGRQNVNWDSGLTTGYAVGSQHGAGGSHGGLGSIYDGNGIPTLIYDGLTNPTDLGSGGGNWGTVGSGAGGGLVLISAGSITLDGAIIADGGGSNGSAAGSGSGGTVNITSGSLGGMGTISANGGGNGVGVGGGGGRVAIIHSGPLGFALDKITAIGGLGQYGRRGGVGTIFTRATAQTYGTLIIDGQNLEVENDTASIPGNLIFDAITLRNHARATADEGLNVTGSLWLTGNSVLTHSPENEAGLAIEARDVQIDNGSAIDTTGRGYRGGRQGTNWDVGLTLGGLNGSQGGTGGSYGGKGGGYQGRDSGLIYGDPRNPVSLGSGGGNWGATGSGAGGGRVAIHTSNSLIVNGAIRANGGFGNGSASGAGSGGSVLIHTSTLSGTGTISANGEGHLSAGVGGDGVGGGGGRIALYCDTLDGVDNFNNLGAVSAFAGHDRYDDSPPSTGTVYLKFNQGSEGLFIDDNSATATAPGATPLPHIGSGLTTAVTADSLTLDGNVLLLPNGLAGLRLNPDTTQGETFVIEGNTANTISMVTPNEHGASFGNLAGVGKQYSGVHHYDNLTFRRGGNLLLGDSLEVPGTLNLAEYGFMSHYGATDTFTSGLYLRVGNFLIDGTSRIDVTGRGYRGGREGYNWDPGLTEGNTSGSRHGAGGSHGGLGGVYDAGGVPASTYDSDVNPTDLGGGGGNWGATGSGAGGGRVLINAATMTLDGAIVAGGGGSNGSVSGSGAGGTVNITATTLTVNGIISANGGSYLVGGGGGRIAIHYHQAFGLNPSNIQALGGQGQYGSGGDGTVYTVLQSAAPPGSGQTESFRVFLPLIIK